MEPLIKICILGAPETGKTALVESIVGAPVSTAYLPTFGVRLSQIRRTFGALSARIILWDVAGDQTDRKLRHYLARTAGYMLVVDATRPATCCVARELHGVARDVVGPVQFLVVVNKIDLAAPDTRDDCLQQVSGEFGMQAQAVSARSGQGVERAFTALASACWCDPRTRCASR